LIDSIEEVKILDSEKNKLVDIKEEVKILDSGKNKLIHFKNKNENSDKIIKKLSEEKQPEIKLKLFDMDGNDIDDKDMDGRNHPMTQFIINWDRWSYDWDEKYTSESMIEIYSKTENDRVVARLRPVLNEDDYMEMWGFLVEDIVVNPSSFYTVGNVLTYWTTYVQLGGFKYNHEYYIKVFDSWGDGMDYYGSAGLQYPVIIESSSESGKPNLFNLPYFTDGYTLEDPYCKGNFKHDITKHLYGTCGTIYQILAASGQHSLLISLIDKVGSIKNDLMNPYKSKVTLFAPTDKAISTRPYLLELCNVEEISNVILSHVLYDDYFTDNGVIFKRDCDDNIMFNNIELIEIDIKCTNGVMHYIDTVMDKCVTDKVSNNDVYTTDNIIIDDFDIKLSQGSKIHLSGVSQCGTVNIDNDNDNMQTTWSGVGNHNKYDTIIDISGTVKGNGKINNLLDYFSLMYNEKPK